MSVTATRSRLSWKWSTGQEGGNYPSDDWKRRRDLINLIRAIVAAGAKRLVIVSDLLQNVPGELNMYDGVPSFDSFESSPYFRRVASDLRGVRVSVYYLARVNATTQSRAHVEFWNRYLLAQGAVIDTLTKVYGAR